MICKPCREAADTYRPELHDECTGCVCHHRTRVAKSGDLCPNERSLPCPVIDTVTHAENEEGLMVHVSDRR